MVTSLSELLERPNIEKLLLCSRASSCGDGSTEFRINSRLYVGSLPKISGLDCKILGMQEKDCTVNTGSYRTLNVAGEYSVRVSNSAGDLLATQSFTIN